MHIVTRSYLRAAVKGKHPKMTPRIPTADLAEAHLRKSIEAHGWTYPEYITREVLDGKDRALVRSSFPQVCDWGLAEYTYWMRDGYDRAEHVHTRVSNRLGLHPDKVYVVRDDMLNVGVPNYRVFVETDEPDRIHVPRYELPGIPPKSIREYEADWSELLGVPVKVSQTFSLNWLPNAGVKHGLWFRGFIVRRRSDVIQLRILWFLIMVIPIAALMSQK